LDTPVHKMYETENLAEDIVHSLRDTEHLNFNSTSKLWAQLIVSAAAEMHGKYHLLCYNQSTAKAEAYFHLFYHKPFVELTVRDCWLGCFERSEFPTEFYYGDVIFNPSSGTLDIDPPENRPDESESICFEDFRQFQDTYNYHWLSSKKTFRSKKYACEFDGPDNWEPTEGRAPHTVFQLQRMDSGMQITLGIVDVIGGKLRDEVDYWTEYSSNPELQKTIKKGLGIDEHSEYREYKCRMDGKSGVERTFVQEIYITDNWSRLAIGLAGWPVDYLEALHNHLGVKDEFTLWLSSIATDETHLKKIFYQLGVVDPWEEYKASVWGDESFSMTTVMRQTYHEGHIFTLSMDVPTQYYEPDKQYYMSILGGLNWLED
jgi:hypothetical protein